MPDIIDLVLKDHLKVAALFDQLKSTSDAVKQKSFFAEVTEALEAHATAEEKVLYPRVRKEVPEGKEEAKDATEEHDQIRKSIKEVQEHEPGTELFALAVDQLIATTKHHVGVEEEELLPDFRNNSEVSEREELGRRFADAKAKTPAA
jgi:hemerythrin superfamily protein